MDMASPFERFQRLEIGFFHDMASPFERFQRLEIGFFHLNQIVDIGHVCMI